MKEVPLLVLLLFFIIGVYSNCDVVYVSSGGSGTTCSAASPCTLATAISGFTSTRPTLWLLGGTYSWTNRLILPSNIKLEGGFISQNGADGIEWVKSSSVA